VDVAFADGGRTTVAAIVVMRLPDLETVETATARLPTRFPYVPGLLSFREVPAIQKALRRLTVAPELLLCDGHGYAHPRRFGLACHLGVIADIPAIGIGKSRLIGRHTEPGPARGDHTPLFGSHPKTGKQERIGAVLRTRPGVKPVYVSIGHRVSLRTALALTARCLGRCRLPEPVRLADKLSKAR
jgi:deoxyribonuclease V